MNETNEPFKGLLGFKAAPRGVFLEPRGEGELSGNGNFKELGRDNRHWSESDGSGSGQASEAAIGTFAWEERFYGIVKAFGLVVTA